MKLDDAEYYYLNFTLDTLSADAGATHIGMFFAWQVLSRATERYLKPEAVQALVAREITPGAFILKQWDGKFSSDYLDEDDAPFAEAYYPSAYLEDYAALFGVSADDVDEFCGVADTWENYDRVEAMLDERFIEWSLRNRH
jgi:hypothetical protein